MFLLLVRYVATDIAVLFKLLTIVSMVSSFCNNGLQPMLGRFWHCHIRLVLQEKDSLFLI